LLVGAGVFDAGGVAGALRNVSVEPEGAAALRKYGGAVQALHELKASSDDTTTARYASALLKNLKNLNPKP
jgi:hypothetical protein